MNFENKIVLITGASSGIGEALAYSFAKRKSHILLVSRNEKELERVKSNCQLAASTMIYKMDLADIDSIQDTSRKILERYGKVDYLINNAGISQRALAKDTTLEVDRIIMETNYLGTIALTKALIPKMWELEKGHITTITSLTGKFGTPLRSSYAASKHALHGFFDSLRAELHDRGIKILLVCPGFVKTNISINAMIGNGTSQKIMDESTANGLEPNFIAEKIIRAIEKNKEEVNIGGRETRGVLLKRLFPKLFSKMIRKAKVV
jgi:dehydrogenase/reductase SDR family member 7B